MNGYHRYFLCCTVMYLKVGEKPILKHIHTRNDAIHLSNVPNIKCSIRNLFCPLLTVRIRFQSKPARLCSTPFTEWSVPVWSLMHMMALHAFQWVNGCSVSCAMTSDRLHRPLDIKQCRNVHVSSHETCDFTVNPPKHPRRWGSRRASDICLVTAVAAVSSHNSLIVALIRQRIIPILG